MGVYVDPPGEEKEIWLETNGKITRKEDIDFNKLQDSGYFPVVLVNNGLFTAAGIAFSESELERFTNPEDERPKTIYIVEKDKLFEVSDLESWISK